ncbi:MAG: carboxypeptidase-like regulatory domain-containing protein [Candidatus Neomarinimicrobiota bacterium]
MVVEFGILFLVFAFVLPTTPALVQMGKITGQLTSAATRKPLPGANVLLVGTDLGTTTDQEGYYRITRVPPGSYDIQITFVGYTRTIVEDVKVNIYLTTTINFNLKLEVLEGQEVTITTAQPVVQMDVAAHLTNLDAKEVENLPIATIEDGVRLRAGSVNHVCKEVMQIEKTDGQGKTLSIISCRWEISWVPGIQPE